MNEHEKMILVDILRKLIRQSEDMGADPYNILYMLAQLDILAKANGDK